MSISSHLQASKAVVLTWEPQTSKTNLSGMAIFVSRVDSCHHIYRRLAFCSYSPGEIIPAGDTFGNCKIHYHKLTEDLWMNLRRRNWSKAVHCCAVLQTFWRRRVFDYALSPRKYNVSQLSIIVVDYIWLCRNINSSENSSRTGISSSPF